MRLLAAAAFLGCAIPAQAEDSPVRLQPLAPGEVLLEADGFAIVATPASFATVSTTLYASGATDAEARRAMAAEVERVSAIARAAGAAPGDISVLQTDIIQAQMRDFDVDEAPGDGDSAQAAPRHNLSASVEIRLRNASRALGVHRQVGTGDMMTDYSGPAYTLEDDSGPRAEARRRALAAARADAESGRRTGHAHRPHPARHRTRRYRIAGPLCHRTGGRRTARAPSRS